MSAVLRLLRFKSIKIFLGLLSVAFRILNAMILKILINKRFA